MGSKLLETSEGAFFGCFASEVEESKGCFLVLSINSACSVLLLTGSGWVNVEVDQGDLSNRSTVAQVPLD